MDPLGDADGATGGGAAFGAIIRPSTLYSGLYQRSCPAADSSYPMAAQPETRTDSYRCPECGGAVLFAHGAWGCTECRYVPPHSAD
jgi:predicted RNA-binding Zn-ribbon protein involved in translation (DUF1610 family)